MLTFPSKPVSQIVLSMDDPPNPFCSAPPHSEPAPPPLPSVTPSCVNYGLSGSRRSSRIQDSQSPKKAHGTERRAAQKPYLRPSPSPSKRPTADMVQVSQNVPSRVERTPEKEPRDEDELDFGIASESISDNFRLKRPNVSLEKPNASLEQTPTKETNVTEKTAPNPQHELETCSIPAPDSAPVPKSWVIGPLFQSFKSKMASFTEIVMSPAKLFKSNSVNENEPDEPSAAECSRQIFTFEPGESGEDYNRDKRQTDISPPSPGCVSELSIDEDLPEKADECVKDLADSVPSLQTPLLELESTVNRSAWNKSALKISNQTEEQSWSARTRKRQDKATPKINNQIDLNKADSNNINLSQYAETESEMNTESFIQQSIKSQTDKSEADLTPTITDEEGIKKVKRTLNLSGQAAKRKKTAAKVEQTEAVKADLNSSSLVKKRKQRKEDIDEDETPKMVRKATRANKKCKVEEEAVSMSNKDSVLVNSIGKSSEASDENPKSAKAKAKATTRTKGKVDASLDLQTMMEISKEAELELVPVVLLLPLETKKREKIGTANKKRKVKEHLNTGVVNSTSSELSREMLENTAVDVYVAQKKEESGKTGRKQPQKKPKMDPRDSATSNADVVPKNNQAKKGRRKNAVDPVYFEMTPFENNVEPVSLASQKSDSDVSRESGVSNKRTRRVDSQRRKCRVINSRTRKRDNEMNSSTLDDTDLFKASTKHSSVRGFSTRLQRSHSCPEIPLLRLHEASWTSHSTPPGRSHPIPQLHSAPSVLHSHFHRSSRRARRHTVCSVEVEREIAPLCLRKEVYPARRSPSPYDPQHHSPVRTKSPGATLTALASCFLSSPLAFLSKKSDGRGAPGSPGRAPSPCSTSLTSLLGTSLGQLPGFHLRTDTTSNSDSSNSGSLLVCETERRPQSEEDDEDTSSSSQEFEDTALREEKALSDSEIKVVKKDEEQRKVSSIRIRKTLPKPQNNLTPMGLPKPIRVKKKEFSLEEIYTNKNFSKPPESRLETIFEVPPSRKNGSEIWFGQRRIKRFLEFLEVGEVRKPKKPLVGAAKPVNANSRTRRSGSGREEPPLNLRDLDSLLCAKLDQLNLWLTHDLKDS